MEPFSLATFFLHLNWNFGMTVLLLKLEFLVDLNRENEREPNNRAEPYK